MFSVSSGGRDIAKKTLAPQTKITIEISSGMTRPGRSRAHRPPWMFAPIAFGVAAAVAHRVEDDQAGDQQREEHRDREQEEVQASTRPAIVDACSGKSGVPDHMARASAALCRRAGRAACGASRRTMTTMNAPSARTVAAPASRIARMIDQAVAAGHRVVVIAVEQERVDRRCRPCRPTPRRAPAQIARAVLDAEEIAREPAVRRQHDDAGRVRELLQSRRPTRSGSRPPSSARSIDG